jgi:hypothetical protein
MGLLVTDKFRDDFVIGVIQLAATFVLTGILLYLIVVVRLDPKWLAMLILTSFVFAFTSYYTRDKWGN